MYGRSAARQQASFSLTFGNDDDHCDVSLWLGGCEDACLIQQCRSGASRPRTRVARYKRTMAQPLDGARSAMLAEILQRQLVLEQE
jgi:hypothetical protein